MINASHEHLNQAQLFEARGELEEALREYRRASDFDPPNRQLAAKVTEMERRIRDQYEAQPRNNIAQLREQARQAGPPPLIKLTEVLPEIRFNNTSIRDILNFIANATGINVTYDRDYQDRAYTVQLNGVTLEQALNQILSANQLFYKVVNERTIMVIADNPQKRANYEEQVIRTFYVSHADATELAQMINTIIRVPAMAVQPMIAPNKTSNTITIRATTAVAAIIEKMIEANDKPRAEIVIDVQILEISRGRAKTFGLDLSNYSLSTVFSPETDPRGTTRDRRHADDVHAASVQPEHDHARDLDRRFLPGGAVGRRAVPRDRHRDEADREAAAARRRRAEDHAQPRRPDSRALHGVHAAGHRRREHEPADVVHLQGRRHQRRDDAARHARGRHHPRPVGGEQHARRRRQRRRAEPAVVREPEGQHAACGCATASRTCSRACCARTTARRCRVCPAWCGSRS